ncbi:Uncharacterized protein dnl_56250 [Desulfonema limicola]|uniref:Uncharacterized protein n=1 Tax=Desulfonema limicola TaxID=45656 RepID=A0A975BDJ4_9BACT|nr:Uncharacterized protein dnl_56250 [Desulfonema limicola]
MLLKSAIIIIFLFYMINIANAGIMAATHGGHTITEIYLHSSFNFWTCYHWNTVWNIV